MRRSSRQALHGHRERDVGRPIGYADYPTRAGELHDFDITIPAMKIDPAKLSETKGMKVEVEATPRLLFDSIDLSVTPVRAFSQTP